MVFTHSYQPVALLVYNSVGESELVVFGGERLDVAGPAGQLCLVQPLVSAGVINDAQGGETEERVAREVVLVGKRGLCLSFSCQYSGLHE